MTFPMHHAFAFPCPFVTGCLRDTATDCENTWLGTNASADRGR